MVKQGGRSWNGSPASKKGVQGNHKCSICARQYKMSEHRDRHEKQCKEFNRRSD